MSDLYAEVIKQYDGDLVAEGRVQALCMTQNYSADLIRRLTARVAQLEACLTDVKEQLEMRGIRK